MDKGLVHPLGVAVLQQDCAGWTDSLMVRGGCCGHRRITSSSAGRKHGGGIRDRELAEGRGLANMGQGEAHSTEGKRAAQHGAARAHRHLSCIPKT